MKVNEFRRKLSGGALAVAEDLVGVALKDDVKVIEGAGHFGPGVNGVAETDGGRPDDEIRRLNLLNDARHFGARRLIADQIRGERLFEFREQYRCASGNA